MPPPSDPVNPPASLPSDGMALKGSASGYPPTLKRSNSKLFPPGAPTISVTGTGGREKQPSQQPQQQEQQQASNNLLMDDENENINSGWESETHLCNCCYRLPPWAQFALYSLCGSAVFLSPAIVIFALNIYQKESMDPIICWSFFLTIAWVSWLVIWRVVGILPSLITSIILFFFKQCHESIRVALEFVSALQMWVTLAAWQIVLVIFYNIIFLSPFFPYRMFSPGADAPDPYKIIANVLSTSMVFFICVFFQKFFLHSIAVNFHRSAYSARIKDTKKSLHMIDRLRKAIKIFEFADVFHVGQSSPVSMMKEKNISLTSSGLLSNAGAGDRRFSRLWWSPGTMRQAEDDHEAQNTVGSQSSFFHFKRSPRKQSQPLNENLKDPKLQTAPDLTRTPHSHGYEKPSPPHIESASPLSAPEQQLSVQAPQVSLMGSEHRKDPFEQIPQTPQALPQEMKSVPNSNLSTPLLRNDNAASTSPHLHVTASMSTALGSSDYPSIQRQHSQSQVQTLNTPIRETILEMDQRVSTATRNGNSQVEGSGPITRRGRSNSVGSLGRKKTSYKQTSFVDDLDRKPSRRPTALPDDDSPPRSAPLPPVLTKRLSETVRPRSPSTGQTSKSKASSPQNRFISLFKEFTQAQYSKLSSVRADVTSNKQARKLAVQLFRALCRPDRSEVFPDDFEPYFDTSDEATEAFHVFDTDKNGSINVDEMKAAVVAVYKERKALWISLRQLSTSLGKLDHFFYIFTSLVTLIVVLPIWGIPISAILPFTSILLALSFIFGGSAKTTFDCLIFIFVYHPFDVGDRISVDNQTFRVDTVALLTSTLIRSDGQIVIVPNAVLLNKFINNYRRSGDQSETIEIHFDFLTPIQKLKELQSRMARFVSTQARDFHSCDFGISTVENANRLICSFNLKYKGNWQDAARKIIRRNNFMYALVENMIELGLSYSAPPQMSFDRQATLLKEVQTSNRTYGGW